MAKNDTPTETQTPPVLPPAVTVVTVEAKPRDIRDILAEERKRRSRSTLRYVGKGTPPTGQFSYGMERDAALPDEATQRAGFDFPLAAELAATHPGEYKFVIGGRDVDPAPLPDADPADLAVEDPLGVAEMPDALAPLPEEAP